MTSRLSSSVNRYLFVGLWLAQIIVALVFAASGLTKVFIPIAELTRMMTWPGDYPLAFVRTLGLVDLAGAVGMLLPSLTRVYPQLAVLAAGCCTLLQILAIGFHASRGEFSVLPLNLALLPMCILVLWGRGKRMPVRGR